MTVELGVIEGYYGPIWSWEDRAQVLATLAPQGYGFFIYAPKADSFLRRRWREDHPADVASGLKALAQTCARLGVDFGVGLSPYEIYRDFNTEAKAALGRKLAALDDMGVQTLAILFDDMRGDLPKLAETQARILHWVAEHTKAKRLITCPTYYSDTSMLDRVFGNRPPGYLQDLGVTLDPAIEIFWTGEEVCSLEFSPGHLQRVAEQLRRKPLLWDNYPVNDSPAMSQSLHLRGFTGRPASIAPYISGHAINPALQPILSCVPALTLAESYRTGADYEYVGAFRRAANAVLGEEMGELMDRHINLLQDTGLDRLGDRAARLRERYDAMDHPAAREIVRWLDGGYKMTAEMVEAS